MAIKPLTMNPNYLAMVRGTRELHRLLAAGKDDSPEADALRDVTDGPWEALSELERNRVRSLSEDLYSLVEPPLPVLPMDPQAQVKLNEAFEAKQRGEWDKALDLLRRSRAHVDPALVSYLRGAIWMDAGDADTAVLFFEHASRLKPENGSYLAIFLYALEKVDPNAALTRAREILQDPDKMSPITVVRAANIVFDASRSLSNANATPEWRELISVIERALARSEVAPEESLDSSHYGIGILLLSFCHELLGNTKAAVDALTRGLHVDPDNAAFLGTRGILLYGASPQAITDLELAVRNGSTEIWPYYFLAQHYLLTGRFEECRRLCELALGMNGSPAVMSEVSEWMAIAQAELGFPTEMVRVSFENAIRFDPANQRAKRNLTAFEAASKPITRKIWESRSASAVRTSGLAERRFAPSE